MATPWEDCPYAISNANTFVSACAYRILLTSCVGIGLGGRGGQPTWPPATLGYPLGRFLHTQSENPLQTRLPQWCVRSELYFREERNHQVN